MTTATATATPSTTSLTPLAPCLHCKLSYANSWRRLCKRCYAAKEVRVLYPVIQQRQPGQTAVDKLVIVAAEMSRKSARMKLYDLVIAAWQRYPATFCIPDHPGLASDNRVIVTLLQKYGPVKKGWIVRVARLVYCLTGAGHEYADMLARGERPARVNGSKRLQALDKFLTAVYRHLQSTGDVSIATSSLIDITGYADPIAIAKKLVNDGLLRRLDSGRFSLTEEGAERAVEIGANGGEQ